MMILLYAKKAAFSSGQEVLYSLFARSFFKRHQSHKALGQPNLMSSSR